MSTSHTTIQKQITNLSTTQEVVPGTERLEDQLHEQYAINNNSNATTLIAILSALTIGFAGYGYVVCNYYPHTCPEQRLMMKLASIMVIELLVLLYVLSINFGVNQRLEQFITFSIRAKRYNLEEYEKVFPENYHPYGKSFCSYVQGVYNTLSWVMVIGVVYVVITTMSLSDCLKSDLIFNSSWSVSLLYMLYHRLCRYRDYQKRQGKYLSLLEQSLIVKKIICQINKGNPNPCDKVNRICITKMVSLFVIIGLLFSLVGAVLCSSQYKSVYRIILITMAFCGIYVCMLIYRIRKDEIN